MVRLLLLTLLVSVCSGRSVLGPNDSLERAKEIVWKANRLISFFGISDAPLLEHPRTIVGHFSSMALRGDDQYIEDDVREGVNRTKVAFKLGWDNLYLTSGEGNESFSVRSHDNILNINFTAYSKRPFCYAKISQASLDLGNLEGAFSPEREEEFKYWYANLYPQILQYINEVVLKERLDDFNRIPIVQTILCVFLQGSFV